MHTTNQAAYCCAGTPVQAASPWTSWASRAACTSDIVSGDPGPKGWSTSIWTTGSSAANAAERTIPKSSSCFGCEGNIKRPKMYIIRREISCHIELSHGRWPFGTWSAQHQGRFPVLHIMSHASHDSCDEQGDAVRGGNHKCAVDQILAILPSMAATLSSPAALLQPQVLAGPAQHATHGAPKRMHAEPLPRAPAWNVQTVKGPHSITWSITRASFLIDTVTPSGGRSRMRHALRPQLKVSCACCQGTA